MCKRTQRMRVTGRGKKSNHTKSLKVSVFFLYFSVFCSEGYSFDGEKTNQRMRDILEQRGGKSMGEKTEREITMEKKKNAKEVFVFTLYIIIFI